MTERIFMTVVNDRNGEKGSIVLYVGESPITAMDAKSWVNVNDDEVVDAFSIAGEGQRCYPEDLYKGDTKRTKFNHTAHKEMWTWLAENPEMEKKDWPGWKAFDKDYFEDHNLCFACEFISKTDLGCENCPIDWPRNRDGLSVCDGIWGLWAKWEWWEEQFSKKEERASLALQIANLPVKEGVETE